MKTILAFVLAAIGDALFACEMLFAFQAAKIRDERKVTIKAVYGDLPDIEKLLKAPNKSMDLIDLVGIVRRAKPDSHSVAAGETSDFVRFYGEFRAINRATGEVVEAGQAILPGAIQDKLYGALGVGDKVKEISFAIRIGIRYDKNALRHYVYTTESLLPPSENDALSQLAVLAGVKQLAFKEPPKAEAAK